jgi:galactokinase
MQAKNIKVALHRLYGTDPAVLTNQSDRYQHLDAEFISHFGEQERFFFSTPGRTEIGGNHTDHNHGRVLAASINLDSVAVAAKNNDHMVTVYSKGYQEPFQVDLKQLDPVVAEKGTTTALIRGIASRLTQLNGHIGGFNAVVTSDVLPGSGLSSSASIEVLLGTIFNNLYNNNCIQPEILAHIGQYAENNYFDKPCGLMDQMACAVGGIISIDFEDPQKPLVKKVDFSFDRERYSLLVVNTGGSHVDLTADYAAVPTEMKSVAKIFNSSTMRDVSHETFLKKILKLRKEVGDRAVLRAWHFLHENDRVVDEVRELESGNFERFLELVKASGDSSAKWLQNIFSTKDVQEQGVTLALALTEKYISDINAGACRVHGGGFAGTIMVFLPDDQVAPYKDKMSSIFGLNSVLDLKIRQQGTVSLNRLI